MRGRMIFRQDRGSAADVAEHLSGCDAVFVAQLGARVDLSDFAARIAARAARFEAWADEKLVGLVAAYCNDTAGAHAFINHVGVWPAHGRRGVAAKLLESCIEHARKCGMRTIELEVSRDNARAIALYRGFGFQPLATEQVAVAMRLLLDKGGTR